MDLRVTPFLLLFTCSCSVHCSPGDTLMFLPPMEVRSMDSNQRPMIPFANPEFSNNMQLQPINQDLPPRPPQRQTFVHTSPPPHQVPSPEVEPTEKHHNFTINDFIEALNEVEGKKEEGHESRAAEKDSDYSSSSYPPYSSHRPPGPLGGSYYMRPPNYGAPPPGYGPSPSSGYSSPYPGYGGPPPGYGPPAAPAPSYNQPPPAKAPTAIVHHPDAKEDFDILKPVKTKIATKVSGLIGLVLALLTGSATDDLELKGFKDIVINGIVKPLLIAKGGIKSLISKLTIPVIALLLINLEVLVTIWWLWDDCPAQAQPAPYVYPYPKPGQY